MKHMIRGILTVLLVVTLLLGAVACGTVEENTETGTAAGTGIGTDATTTAKLPLPGENTDTDTDVGTNPSAKLLFEENFDGTALDPNKWEFCPEWDRQGGASRWSNDMVEVADGELLLRARWDSSTQKVVAGAIWTNKNGKNYDRFDKAGGYYEARIKFPVAKGVWGAFWIMAGNIGTIDGTSTSGAEIDVIESIDCSAGTFNHAVHWDGYDTAHQQVEKRLSSPAVYDGEYHVYGFERGKGGYYVFYVDGKETWRTKAAGLCVLPGYLMLSLESGYGYGSGTAECIAQLPAEMAVDYVRVYAEKP